MMKKTILLLLLFVMALNGACASNQKPDAAIELTISAAASMTEALNELKETFESSHSHIKLLFNYGASGALQRQIEQGAPVDLFISASVNNMDALVDKGFVAHDQRKNLLLNELVVVTPKESKLSLRDERSLLEDSVRRIAIGIPESVPAGAYAKEALENAKLWESLKLKTVQAKDVKQVLQYVETGNVEAGFVYRTDALASASVQIAFQVQPGSYSSVLYPIGIVEGTRHARETKELYDFMGTEEAQLIYKKYGFSVPR